MISRRSTHLVIFAKQFASMMASSLQLVSVLDNLASETPHRRLRQAVVEMAGLVRSGTDLADAMARHPGLFDGVFLGLVRSGIEAGQLPQALGHVVDYLDRVEQLNRRVMAAAVYPVFVLLIFVAVAGGMIFFILPKYEAIFRSFGRDLPGATQFPWTAPALGGALAVAAIWATLSGATAERLQAMDTLATTLSSDTALRSALARRLASAEAPPPEPLFLTEKLLAISRAVPDGLRLDRVASLADGGAARDNRIVLEGRVQTTGPSYIRTINTFIDRLSADEALMRGVSSISLLDASTSPEPGRDAASFKAVIVLATPSRS